MAAVCHTKALSTYLNAENNTHIRIYVCTYVYALSVIIIFTTLKLFFKALHKTSLIVAKRYKKRERREQSKRVYDFEFKLPLNFHTTSVAIWCAWQVVVV